MKVLPKMLEAATHFNKLPTDIEMSALINKFDIQPIFHQ